MKPFEVLDETFDIVPAESVDAEIVTTSEKEKAPKNIDKDKDYEIVRSNLHSLIMKGQQIVDEVMDVAAQSQHPRAYEVAINSVKNVSEVADKLIDLHKKIQDLSTEEVKITQNNSQTNVFVAGTTAEIMKMLKDSKSSK